MAEHQLSDEDDGATVEAHVGDVIEVRLNETASGGYSWSVESAGGSVLQPMEPRRDFAAGEVGGRSVARFGFTVEGPGESAIRLEYKRPWEKGEPALRSYQVTVVAR